jgi:hypothetical protein
LFQAGLQKAAYTLLITITQKSIIPAKAHRPTRNAAAKIMPKYHFVNVWLVDELSHHILKKIPIPKRIMQIEARKALNIWYSPGPFLVLTYLL